MSRSSSTRSTVGGTRIPLGWIVAREGRRAAGHGATTRAPGAPRSDHNQAGVALSSTIREKY